MSDWVGYKGRSFVRDIYVKDINGNVVDLTNYDVNFILSKDGVEIFTKSSGSTGVIIVDPTAGKAQVNLTPTDTATLLGIYAYEVDLESIAHDLYPITFDDIEFKDPLAVRTSRVPVYCQPEDVVAQLQLLNHTNNQRIVLDDIVSLGNVNISLTEMQNKIMQYEDFIDRACWDQWRIKSSEVEYLNTDNLWPGWFPHELLVFVYGNHLQPFNGSSGDILKIRRGDQWVDMLSTYTEGIGRDFWVEYPQGIIHFYNQRPQYGNEMVMVKYRWGNSEVPYDIKRAVVLLCAADYLRSEIYAVMAGEGPGYVSQRERTAEHWVQEAERIMSMHRRTPWRMMG